MNTNIQKSETDIHRLNDFKDKEYNTDKKDLLKKTEDNKQSISSLNNFKNQQYDTDKKDLLKKTEDNKQSISSLNQQYDTDKKDLLKKIKENKNGLPSNITKNMEYIRGSQFFNNTDGSANFLVYPVNPRLIKLKTNDNAITKWSSSKQVSRS